MNSKGVLYCFPLSIIRKYLKDDDSSTHNSWVTYIINTRKNYVIENLWGWILMKTSEVYMYKVIVFLLTVNSRNKSKIFSCLSFDGATSIIYCFQFQYWKYLRFLFLEVFFKV